MGTGFAAVTWGLAGGLKPSLSSEFPKRSYFALTGAALAGGGVTFAGGLKSSSSSSESRKFFFVAY